MSENPFIFLSPRDGCRKGTEQRRQAFVVMDKFWAGLYFHGRGYELSMAVLNCSTVLN
jgi:hypothetical protein